MVIDFFSEVIDIAHELSHTSPLLGVLPLLLLLYHPLLAPVVQKVDNAIHRINHYPLDIAIGFAITYPVDSDLSGG